MTAAEALQSTDPLTAAMAFQLKEKGLSWEEALAEVGANFKADEALADALTDLQAARDEVLRLKVELAELEGRLEEGAIPF